MPRGIDHIVHAVRDLDAAAEFYRGLGFTVGARNRHPPAWGTENHIIQTPDTFIELLAVAAPAGIAAHGLRHFSFGAFNRDFLGHAEGLSMLVLKGRGRPDTDEFRDKGIGGFELYEFERQGRRPDGTPLTVSFALAFAADPLSPDAGFFTCQHRHPPENFWNPAFQTHANGVTGVAGIVAVARTPEAHCTFLQAFIGAQAEKSAGGFVFDTPRGMIELTTPGAFLSRFGTHAPDPERGIRLAAIRFTGGKPHVIGVNDAMGAVLVFEPASGR